LLNKAKQLEISNKPSIQYVKNWKKNKPTAIFCKYYKLRGHTDNNCTFLHPEKAPKGWKTSNSKAAFKVQKTSQKHRQSQQKLPREKREERIAAIITASTPKSSSISETASQTESEIEDIIFEDVPLGNSLDAALKVNNNNNHTLLNTITNNPLVLKHSLKDLLD